MTPGFRLAPHIGLVHRPGPPQVAYLADLRHGPVLALPGPAAVILLVALELPPAEVSPEVADLTDADVATVRPHVERHLETLAERGFLTPTG